ncbi:MAG: 3-dehydroquinate synthase [Candidatus Gastranaerophilales bacterium]|nr:3-dehydroquinate synthase [Candidatus Gastranaerophilales bacterium]
MREVTVDINSVSEKKYPIIIGEDLLEKANEYLLRYCPASKYFIITNEKIDGLWGKKLNIENAEKFIIPDGEKYKNYETLISILNKASELKLDRKCAFVAFGGGVIGDITGFAASVYRRGVDFVQIPTTLLAQVDSSVGGKTAVNNEYGKNLIGTFYQPKLVLADTKTLTTLDERQLKTGFAEVVKYAFIEKTCDCGEFNFIDFLSGNISEIKKLNLSFINEAVEICCKLKAAVVHKDEKENGLRAILNLGHTYGHALEKCSNYSIFTHGEAVALGLQVCFDLSFALNLISEEYYNQASELINMFEFNLPEHPYYTPEMITSAMKFDKKVKDGKIIFILPTNVGEVAVFDNIETNLLHQILA